MSEREPIVRFSWGLEYAAKGRYRELDYKIRYEAHRKTVWELGRRATIVALEIGTVRSKPRYWPVKSQPLEIGRLDDTDFSLSFKIFFDNFRRLSKDRESVRRIIVPQRLNRAEPVRLESWIKAYYSDDDWEGGMSALSVPPSEEMYRLTRGDYAESMLENIGSALPPDEEGYRRHDFLKVAGHILTCVRFAEHQLDIEPPAEEQHMLPPDIYDVLAVPRDVK